VGFSSFFFFFFNLLFVLQAWNELKYFQHFEGELLLNFAHFKSQKQTEDSARAFQSSLCENSTPEV